ncbi:MAG: hypothetical protein R3F02_18540 [Thiolinea sp.]
MQDITTQADLSAFERVAEQGGTITVTETRTRTITSRPAANAPVSADYCGDYDDGQIRQSVGNDLFLWLLMAGCVLAAVAAAASMLKELIIVVQANPVGFAIVGFLLIGGIGMFISALKGGR